MGRKILFVTTDQQRYDTLGCNGGTVARTPVVDGLAAAGLRYERAHPAVGRVHAIALDDHHRSAPEHSWRVDERCCATRRRSVGGGRVARQRLPNSLDRQAALRAVPRPVRQIRGEPLRHRRSVPACTAGSSTSSRQRTAHKDLCTTPVGWLRIIPEAVEMFYPVLDGALEVNAMGGGDSGAPQVYDNAIPQGVVPHGLGGRSHHRLARLARCRRRLVLLDELPRSSSPVGSACIRDRSRRLARRSAASGLHQRSRPSAKPCSTPSPAIGERGTTDAWSPTTRPHSIGSRQRSRPIRSARSTPATPSNVN